MRPTSSTALRRDAGMIIPTLAMILVPLMVLAAAGVLVGTSMRSGTVETIDQEKALMAAESAVDVALYMAEGGTLLDGVPVSATVGGGLSYRMEPADMAVDGVDQDGDGDNTNERGFLVTATGSYRGNRRTLVAYIRPTAIMPDITATVSLQDPAANLDISGNAFTISGDDHSVLGIPTGGTALPGATIVDPGTTASLLAGLSGAQQSKITGSGGTPSAAVTTDTIDVDTLVDDVRSVAQNLLLGGNYSAIPNFGNALTNTWRVTHVQGDLHLTGNLTGAGILAVDGNVHFGGNMTFVGIVLIKGNVRFSGGGTSKTMRGALIVGGDADLGGVFAINGGVDLQFSSAAVAAAAEVLERPAVGGWRETRRL